MDGQNRARLQRRETEKENRRSQKIDHAKQKMLVRRDSRGYWKLKRGFKG
jgi:hypothetical protein